MTTIKGKSEKHEKADEPGVGVRVWYGREYVEGPDCRLTGWFYAVFDHNGEGDPTGPFNGRDGKAEATRWALGILETL